MAWLLAVPMPVSYAPLVFEAGEASAMTYWDRAQALFQYVGIVSVYLRGIAGTTQLYRERFGPDFPDVAHIARESPLVFVNTHELVDFPRPTLHNVVHLGGLGVKVPTYEENSTIAEPFASECAKGKLGLVYFSFGTVVSTKLLPTPFIKNLVEAFSLLEDFHFLVKVDPDEKRFDEILSSTDQKKNIYLSSWFPQPEIFAGGRVKAFITHGGYNSLMEAALNGNIGE